jgi:hypothetical protein
VSGWGAVTPGTVEETAPAHLTPAQHEHINFYLDTLQNRYGPGPAVSRADPIPEAVWRSSESVARELIGYGLKDGDPGQDELAGGGQVMGAAGQHVADPQGDVATLRAIGSY